MSERTLRLKEELLAELAEAMIVTLKNEGGIYPTEQEHYKLKEKLMDALQGNIRV